MPPGCRGPRAEDWAPINRRVPRMVDCLPNGPRNFATVQVFLAGGVPEVMLHLRRAGLLDTAALTVSRRDARTRCSMGGNNPSGAYALRQVLHERDGIDPDDVIMSPTPPASAASLPRSASRMATLRRRASVIKSTAIDPSVVDADGVYRKSGPARVFTSEPAAIARHQAGRDPDAAMCWW